MIKKTPSPQGGGETGDAERDGDGTDELTHGQAPRAGGGERF